MLYKHRKDFFKDKIGNWTRKDDPWFTNGTDDTHYFEVIPFQITKNHDEVMAGRLQQEDQHVLSERFVI